MIKFLTNLFKKKNKYSIGVDLATPNIDNSTIFLVYKDDQEHIIPEKSYKIKNIDNEKYTCFCGKSVEPIQNDPATIWNSCTGGCNRYFCEEHQPLLKFLNNYLQCPDCREKNKHIKRW